LALIKRRHVIYVSGYDPQGPTGYYRLFQRGLQKFMETWPVRSELGPLEIESSGFAHWSVTATGPNWGVATHYEFVRYDDLFNGNLSQPLHRQIARALWWIFGDLVSGTTARIVRASPRFSLHLFLLQLALLIWLAASIAAGVLAGVATSAMLTAPLSVSLTVGAVVAVLVLIVLRPLIERWYILRINNCWPYYREFGAGQPSSFERPIGVGAERLSAAVTANEADEVVVIGHSSGGLLAPAMLARALARDPDLGRRGPRVIMLTLGSVMPAVALHPQAQPLRDIIHRIAIEPSIRWIDCQSRKDAMNFWDFDPVAGVSVQVDTERCNPLIWKVRFRDMLSPEYYARLRTNFFRMHYQFVMACDRRAAYDFFMLVCGPLPVTEWAQRGEAALAEFAADGAYTGGAVAAPQPARTIQAVRDAK
jgi:hypothetical protein